MATNKRELSSQRMLQDSYDVSTGVLAMEEIAFDGTTVPQRTVSKQTATKVTIVGTVLYVGKAPIGSLQSAAVWQVKKVDSTTDILITWADANSNFDNVATDLTALTYS